MDDKYLIGLHTFLKTHLKEDFTIDYSEWVEKRRDDEPYLKNLHNYLIRSIHPEDGGYVDWARDVWGKSSPDPAPPKEVTPEEGTVLASSSGGPSSSVGLLSLTNGIPPEKGTDPGDQEDANIDLQKEIEDRNQTFENSLKHPDTMAEIFRLKGILEKRNYSPTSIFVQQTRQEIKRLKEIVNAEPVSNLENKKELLKAANLRLKNHEKRISSGVGLNNPTAEIEEHKALTFTKNIHQKEVAKIVTATDALLTGTGVGESFLRATAKVVSPFTETLALYYPFSFIKNGESPSSEIIIISKEIKNEISNVLEKNPTLARRLTSQAAINPVSLNEKEKILTEAKKTVFTGRLNNLKKALGVIKTKYNSSTDPEEKGRLSELYSSTLTKVDDLYGTYNVDMMKGRVRDSFKKTVEKKEYGETLENIPALDVVSTLMQGIITAGVNFLTGATSLIASAGSAVSSGVVKDLFDDVGSVSFTLANELNILPNSQKVEGNIWDSKREELNLTPYSIAKTVAGQVGHLVVLVAGLSKGGGYGALGKRFRLNDKSGKLLRIGERQFLLGANQDLKTAKELKLSSEDAFVFQYVVGIGRSLISMVNPDFKFFNTSAGKLLLTDFAANLKIAVGRKAREKVGYTFYSNIGKEIGEETLQAGLEELVAVALAEDYHSDFFTKEKIKTLLATTILTTGFLGGLGLKSNYKGTVTEYYKDLHEHHEVLTKEIDNIISITESKDFLDPKDEKLIENLKDSKQLISNITTAIENSPEDVSVKVIELLVEKNKLVKEMETLDIAYHPEYTERIERLNKKIAQAASNPEAEKRKLLEEKEENPDLAEEYDKKIEELDRKIIIKGVATKLADEVAEKSKEAESKKTNANVLEIEAKGEESETVTSPVSKKSDIVPDIVPSNTEEDIPKQEVKQVENDSEYKEELDDFRKEVIGNTKTEVVKGEHDLKELEVKIKVDPNAEHNLNDPEVRTLAEKVIRGLKEAKIKVDPNILQSNPLGGTAIAVWNAAIDTTILAIRAGSSVDVAIRKAVKQVKKSDWYKNTTKKSTRETKIDETVKGLKELTRPYANARVNPSYTGAKTIIRKSVGLTDTSRKIVTTEKKSLIEKFKSYIRGGKWASKEGEKRKNVFIGAVVEELKKLVSGTLMTKTESTRILNAVRNIKLGTTDEKSGEQVENLIKQVFGIIDKIKTRHFGKVVEAKRKKVVGLLKTRFADEKKFNGLGNLVSYRPSLMSKEQLVEFNRILDMFSSKGKENVDWDAIYALNDKLYEDFLKEAEQETENKSEASNIEEDNSEVISKIETLRDKVRTKLKSGFIEIRALNKELLEKFLTIKPEYFETVSVKKLEIIVSALEDLNNKNLLWRGVYSEHVNREERKIIIAGINGELGDKLLKAKVSWNEDLSNLIKKLVNMPPKEFNYTNTLEKLYDIMLPHADEIIQNFKRNPIYTTIINPVTSKLELSNEETLLISNKLTLLFKKAKRSRLGRRVKRLKGEVAKSLGFSKNASWEFDMQIIGQMYFREKEYLSNKDDKQRSSKAFPMKEHMKAHNDLPEATTLIDPVKDDIVIQGWYTRFTQGDNATRNLVEAIEEYLTKEELAVIRFVEGEIIKAGLRSRFVNNTIKGKALLHLNNYFPRESSLSSKNTGTEESIDLVMMKALFSSSKGGIEGSATKDRTLKSAEPVRFDNTFNSFMNHIRVSNLAFNLSETLAVLQGVSAELTRTKEKQRVHLGKYIGNIVYTLIERRTADRDEGQHTRAEKSYNILRKKSYNFKLIDPIKLVFWDFLSQNIFVSLGKLPNLIRLRKVNKLISNELAHKMRSDFGSTVINRGWSRASTIKELTDTNLSKKKYKTSVPTRWDNFIDLVGKNVISDVTDKLSEGYFNFTDFMLFPLWKERVFKVFKIETGKELSDENYEDLKVKYRKELKSAMARADLVSAEVFSTSALSEYKISRQKKSADNIWGILNTFMKSFSFNEFSVFWKSLRVFTRKNPHSKEELKAMSKKDRDKTLLYRKIEKADARANLLIITGRATAYQTLATAMMEYLLPLALGSNFSDEEKEEIMEKAWTQAIAQYGILLVLGNKGNLYNAVVSSMIVGGHALLNKAQKKEKPPFEILYNTNGYSPLSKHIAILGAHGVVAQHILRAAEVIFEGVNKEIENEGGLTKEDLIEMRAAQHLINMAGLTFGAGVGKLNRLAQIYIENNK